jgi:hypothetical protein
MGWGSAFLAGRPHTSVLVCRPLAGTVGSLFSTHADSPPTMVPALMCRSLPRTFYKNVALNLYGPPALVDVQVADVFLFAFDAPATYVDISSVIDLKVSQCFWDSCGRLFMVGIMVGNMVGYAPHIHECHGCPLP